MLTIKDLEREYVSYNLTETLKSCTIDELEILIRLVLCDDIVGIREKIYDALLTEREYRKIAISTNLECDDNKINTLINYYKYDLADINYTEIKNTMDFYKENQISYENIIQWFPAGLSAKMCFVIYNFMKNNEMTEDEIRSVLIRDFNKTKLLAQNIKQNLKTNNTNYSEDIDFINFMNATVQAISKEKHKTESFSKMYKKLNEENIEVIKRLK